MIRLADRAPAQLSAQGLSVARLGVFALKQLAQLRTYGLLPGVFELWTQGGEADGEPVRASISRFSGVLTVCAASGLSAAALDELREFLSQIGGNRLEGEETLLVQLGIADGGLLFFETGWVMRRSTGRAAQHSTPRSPVRGQKIARAEMLEPVYRLLCRADAHFREGTRYDAWLADFSHRCRYQLAECYTLQQEDDIISTASILFLEEKTALVGGVATDPAHRGEGYARRMMEHLATLADARGLQLWLLSADEPLADFYASCGWTRQLRWVSRALAPV